MHTQMPVGIENFKEAREGYYLVDKTKFICQLIDSYDKVMLFTRPRRFGKTLTMSMLDYFFSIDRVAESQGLFAGMAVDKAGPKYMAEQGKYPVIFMTLKELSCNSWPQLYGLFTFIIQKEYSKHAYIWHGDVLSDAEKNYCARIISGHAQPFEYQVSLLQLTEFLTRYFKQRPIILIDEYDVPLQTAYQYGFYEEAINFFRGWFNASLKGNDYLRFAVLTGVLRIAKESIFSGLNNLVVYSVLQSTYSDVFGFTPEEVQRMATDLGHEEKVGEIRQWYDGYSFGGTDIYNPWSVLAYFHAGCVAEAYWLHTSGNYIIQQLLDVTNVERLKALQELVEGKSITTTLKEGVIYNDLEKSNVFLYTILLMTGYLKANPTTVRVGNMVVYELRIPNLEIKQVYTDEIISHLSETIQIDSLISFKQALLTGNVSELTTQLQKILREIVSFYDAKSPECFYHGLLLGMMCLVYDSHYVVKSNRESGYGRFDIALFPSKTTQYGVIMEFKIASSRDTLEDKAQEAVAQILDRHYDASFLQEGITRIWKYGIAFYGKELCIVRA